MSIWTNLKLRGLKDVFNVGKWGMFLRSQTQDTIKIPKADFQSYIEQIIWRESFADCKRCLKEGQCSHCGCKTPDLFAERDMVCSGGNWTEMLPTAEWNKVKEELGIEIGVKY